MRTAHERRKEKGVSGLKQFPPRRSDSGLLGFSRILWHLVCSFCAHRTAISEICSSVGYTSSLSGPRLGSGGTCATVVRVGLTLGKYCAYTRFIPGKSL